MTFSVKFTPRKKIASVAAVPTTDPNPSLDPQLRLLTHTFFKTG